MTSYWRQKVCLVTGASAGLGRAITTELAAAGATVVVNARRKEPLQLVANELESQHRAAGARVVAIDGDVTVQEDVDRIAAEVAKQLGGLDLLCNCAGRSSRSAILKTTPDDFTELLDANLMSAVRMTRALGPLVISRRGHIVNIGSLASKAAPRYLGAYPASKFALAAYTQQLRLELEPQGVKVLLVCPGPIRREDHGSVGQGRYAGESKGVPASAQGPGGGTSISAIDPQGLARLILNAAERGKAELVVPGKARVLFALSQLWPSLGDWLLLKSMGR